MCTGRMMFSIVPKVCLDLKDHFMHVKPVEKMRRTSAQTSKRHLKSFEKNFFEELKMTFGLIKKID